MIALNHLNLVLSDVSKTVQLFTRHFGFALIETKGDNIIAILKDNHNFTLVLMKEKSGQPVYPKAFHIGFLLNSEAEVHSVYQTLKEDGIEVNSEPGKIRDGFGFYFSFDAFLIEVGLV